MGPKSEEHMHALVLTFDDAQTITHHWTHFKDGKAQEGHPFTLKRT